MVPHCDAERLTASPDLFSHLPSGANAHHSHLGVVEGQRGLCVGKQTECLKPSVISLGNIWLLCSWYPSSQYPADLWES